MSPLSLLVGCQVLDVSWQHHPKIDREDGWRSTVTAETEIHWKSEIPRKCSVKVGSAVEEIRRDAGTIELHITSQS